MFISRDTGPTACSSLSAQPVHYPQSHCSPLAVLSLPLHFGYAVARWLKMEENKFVRLDHHLAAKDRPWRKACREDGCYICCCYSPLHQPSLVQWVVLQVSEDLLLCGDMTNMVPAGGRRSFCLCALALKVKEFCSTAVHSCLPRSSWLAAIGKLPFLSHDAVEWPEGPQQAWCLITR